MNRMQIDVDEDKPFTPIADAVGISKPPPDRMPAPREDEWDYRQSIGAPKRIPPGFDGKPWECDTCGDTKVLMVKEVVQPFTTRKPFYPCPDCTVEPQLQGVLETMGIPKLYWNQTFDNTDKRRAGFSQGPTLQNAYDHAEEYGSSQKEFSPPWLVLSGDVGVGKTRIACCILRDRWDRRKQKGRFINMVDYLDDLKGEIGGDDNKFAAIVKSAQEAPLLVLDDVGVTKDTDWAKERLYALVNYRYNQHMETIITTNVPLNQLDKRTWDRLMSERDGTAKLIRLEGLQSARSGNSY
mgnify:CR=1 FL=1